MVVEPRWSHRSRDIETAVDADRRQRRKQALEQTPTARPARLGDAFRRGNLLLLADDSEQPNTDDPKGIS